jgi:flagellar biosynthesis/type III secretory pathway M-ring protein FliF/YscJ
MFLLVWALMFRPMQKQVVASIKELAASKDSVVATLDSPAMVEKSIGAPEEDAPGLEASSAVLKRQLVEMVQAEPVSMTRTVQAWLREDHI